MSQTTVSDATVQALRAELRLADPDRRRVSALRLKSIARTHPQALPVLGELLELFGRVVGQDSEDELVVLEMIELHGDRELAWPMLLGIVLASEVASHVAIQALRILAELPSISARLRDPLQGHFERLALAERSDVRVAVGLTLISLGKPSHLLAFELRKEADGPSPAAASSARETLEALSALNPKVREATRRPQP